MLSEAVPMPAKFPERPQARAEWMIGIVVVS